MFKTRLTGLVFILLFVLFSVTYTSADEVVECEISFKQETDFIQGKWTLDDIKVGDTITFGRYEQDNNLENDTEEISWNVLEVDKEHQSVLVISKYALDCQTYSKDLTYFDYLTTWMNSYFLAAAFSEREQVCIPIVTLESDTNPVFFIREHSIYSENYTEQGKIFALSISEAERYFYSDEERSCIQTAYADHKRKEMEATDNNCVWWLRTYGLNCSSAIVNNDGEVEFGGRDTWEKGIYVRPALWIDIDTLSTLDEPEETDLRDHKGLVQQDLDEAYKYKELALACQYGIEVEQNTEMAEKYYDLAIMLYERSAEKGSIDAMLDLGELYYNEESIRKDYTKGFKWYEKAAQNDSARAMYKIAYIYENGYLGEKDERRAFEWYEKAAGSGSAGAMHVLGYFYETGKAVKESYENSMHWYLKAAKAGCKEAMCDIGIRSGF